MKILRTPDERFQNLIDYPFKPNYVEIPSGEGGVLRVHYVDEGSKNSDPVLLLHGEPSWSYLYRKMIPIISSAGYRVIALDLIGFGRSDKPADKNDYSYQRHVDWMRSVIEQLNLERIALVCQDWGGLIGLRLVSEMPELFSCVVAANTFLPTGDRPLGEAFERWQKYSQEVPVFDVGSIVKRGCQKPLTEEVVRGYDAPFPNESYKQGARVFPILVPTTPDNPAARANREAWKSLARFEKPFLTAFSDGDPITRGADKILQRLIPAAKGQPHTTINGGGHFLQEDCGEEFARVVVEFLSHVKV